MPYTHYRWFHIAKQLKGVSSFRDATGTMELTDMEAEATIAKWNAINPAEWQYELVKEHIPPARTVFVGVQHPTPWVPKTWHDLTILDANGAAVCTATSHACRDTIIKLANDKGNPS